MWFKRIEIINEKLESYSFCIHVLSIRITVLAHLSFSPDY